MGGRLWKRRCRLKCRCGCWLRCGRRFVHSGADSACQSGDWKFYSRGTSSYIVSHDVQYSDIISHL